MNAPLAIKTRIHPSSDANTLLDPIKRLEVSLEALVQNVTAEGMVFDRVQLEPVHGLTARSIGELDTTTLLPGDTRQHLFIVSPAPVHADNSDSAGPSVPKSTFPPSHAGGTILPIGRLDIAWVSGPYRDPGRLQTSTLNRRTQIQPITKQSRPIEPTSPKNGDLPDLPPMPPDEEWEFDLVVLDINRAGVEVEQEFTIILRVGVRHPINVPEDDENTSTPPSPPKLGIQYLMSAPSIPAPVSSRLPPLSALSTATSNGASRPMTPVTSQIRQATHQTIASPTALTTLTSTQPIVSTQKSSFPCPYFAGPSRPQKASHFMNTGEVIHLGTSLVLLDPKAFAIVEEALGPTYSDPTSPRRRWEQIHKITLRFMAMQEGLAELGALRILILDEDEKGARIGREWDSLGDVWVDD